MKLIKIVNLFYKKKEIIIDNDNTVLSKGKMVVCECGCPLFPGEEMCPDCLKPRPLK